ncbi:MAG: hypothetical protein QOG90_1356 [Actinomycetota bacterium]|jgi:hypothetical protein
MRRPRVAVVVLFVVAALLAGACNKSSGSSDAGDRTNPKSGDVFLEPLDNVGPNAFTQSVALAPVPAVTGGGATGGSSTQGLRSVAGTTPGLYAGSGSQQACDATTGANALVDHDDKAQAWVDALNGDADLSWSGGSKLATEDVATYVGELTSVILQSDTRVTDHGLSDGRAKAFQAVLERGTAVMIDRLGEPRVRCASFSPLTPPTPAGSPKYRGTEWDGFDKTKLVVVTAGGREVDSFKVIDVHTHKQIEILAGASCICDRTQQTTTTSTTEFFETTTTSKTGRTTTTVKKPTATTSHPTTSTTHPPTSTTVPATTTSTA